MGVKKGNSILITKIQPFVAECVSKNDESNSPSSFLFKRGNQTATVLALVALYDYDLGKPSVQASLLHLDCINLLVNLLHANDSRSKVRCHLSPYMS